MSHQIDPPSYRAGDPLPECATCRERSYSARAGACLNGACPSHTACEWCGREAEGEVSVGGDRLCAACARAAYRP